MTKSETIFKKNKKDIINIFEKCINLINERLEIDNKILLLNSKKEELSQQINKNNNDLSCMILYSSEKYSNCMKFIVKNVIPAIFAFCLSNRINILEAIISFIIYFFIFRLIGMLVAKLLIYLLDSWFTDLAIKKNKKISDKFISDELSSNQKIENINKSIEELETEKEMIQKKLNKIDLDGLHDDYKNKDAMTLFIDYFDKGRCDTLKECINLYELEKKNMNLENMIYSVNDIINEQVNNVKDEINNLDSRIKDVDNKASKGVDAASILLENRRGNTKFDDANNELDKIIKK